MTHLDHDDIYIRCCFVLNTLHNFRSDSIMSNHDDKDDTALDTSLDTKSYPVDYVSELFNAIDWGSRVKTKRPTDHWIDPGSWDQHSYTMKYLEYRIEEGQIDLTNPFHIEESNKIRTRLEKKKAVNFHLIVPFS